MQDEQPEKVNWWLAFPVWCVVVFVLLFVPVLSERMGWHVVTGIWALGWIAALIWTAYMEFRPKKRGV